MTELEMLKRRKELVVLAAELQRATIGKRLDNIEANPARKVLGLAASFVRRPAAMKVGSALAAYAVRAWRRRRALRNQPQPAV